MTKRDFLDGLRAALTGEIPEAEVINNIQFYDDYINAKQSEISEYDVINQLGDPRLIAKTIIETYQMSHGPLYNNKKYDKSYQDASTMDGNTYEEHHKYNEEKTENYNSDSFQIHTSFTWYQKLLIVLVAIVVFAVIIIVGGLLLQLFFMIGIPLLIAYFIYRLITSNTRN